jgi:hypothetical protein
MILFPRFPTSSTVFLVFNVRLAFLYSHVALLFRCTAFLLRRMAVLNSRMAFPFRRMAVSNSRLAF